MSFKNQKEDRKKANKKGDFVTRITHRHLLLPQKYRMSQKVFPNQPSAQQLPGRPLWVKTATEACETQPDQSLSIIKQQRGTAVTQDESITSTRGLWGSICTGCLRVPPTVKTAFPPVISHSFIFCSQKSLVLRASALNSKRK